MNLKKRVHFLDNIKNPFKYLHKASIFVTASESESFGNVLVEAMAVGIPVVSTCAPHGPEEIIRDEENGLLVPPRSADALGAAILRVLTDGELSKRLASGGVQTARAYTSANVVALYDALFSELAQKRAGLTLDASCRESPP